MCSDVLAFRKLLHEDPELREVAAAFMVGLAADRGLHFTVEEYLRAEGVSLSRLSVEPIDC